MRIEEIKNKEIWESFLLGCEEKTFLQSWNWGEFQKTIGPASGEKIWRFGIFEENRELLGVAQVIKVEAKRGKFLFVPHGPVVKPEARSQKSKVLEILIKELKKIAGREKVSFIRVAPIWERNKENQKIFRDLEFRTAPIHMHPEITWELNLEKQDIDLLKDMRKTTRYLIRKALENKDLIIEKSQNIKDVEIFDKLYQGTVNRHRFIPFSKKYLNNEVLAFLPDDQILIFLAKYQKEYLASAIVIFWQNIAFYHQGASLQKYPKIPASYFLQWEVIKEAKRRNCRIYNFWGIIDENPKLRKHPWWGLTLFKKGFGGYKREYLKTRDLIISQKYWLNFVVEKIRKIKRHL